MEQLLLLRTKMQFSSSHHRKDDTTAAFLYQLSTNIPNPGAPSTFFTLARCGGQNIKIAVVEENWFPLRHWLVS